MEDVKDKVVESAEALKDEAVDSAKDVKDQVVESAEDVKKQAVESAEVVNEEVLEPNKKAVKKCKVNEEALIYAGIGVSAVALGVLGYVIYRGLKK